MHKGEGRGKIILTASLDAKQLTSELSIIVSSTPSEANTAPPRAPSKPRPSGTDAKQSLIMLLVIVSCTFLEANTAPPSEPTCTRKGQRTYDSHQ